MVEITTRVDGLRAEIEELKSSTIWWSITGLLLAAFSLYLVAATFPDPIYGAVPGMVLLLLSPVIWFLREKLHYLIAAWLLVIGCFGEDAYAIDFLSSLDDFLTAQAPMRIDSTWPMQFFTDEVPDEFGFMVAPPIEDRPQAMIRLMGSGWFIPADTEHPEEAIKFLDYLVSEEVIPLWVEGAKLLPALAGVDYSGLDVRPVYRDFINLVATWDGDLGYHLDVLIPNNVYVSGMKETFPDVMAGRMTAQDAADHIEAESQKAIADGRYVDLTP